ncbi:MAG: four-carbon acid sugar kinase family protein, partial [Beijerinckiaceae bacterium]
MLLGAIADDFTGASDLANTLARSGFRTAQFNGIPAGNAPKDCAAGVVSLKTRSIPVAEAVAQSLLALDWLKRQGCRQIV